jgi:hypothetical protein
MGRSVSLDEERRLWSVCCIRQLRTIDAVHRGNLVHIGRRYTKWALPPSEHNVVDMVFGVAYLTQSTALVRGLPRISPASTGCSPPSRRPPPI